MNLFPNPSTLSLSLQHPNNGQQQSSHQNNSTTTTTTTTTSTSTTTNNNNPYRNPLNSRFTLSFNNLISRTSRVHHHHNSDQHHHHHPNNSNQLHNTSNHQDITSNFHPRNHSENIPIPSVMPNSSPATSPSHQPNSSKSPYFPGLRRIQSRKRDKESTSTDQNISAPPLPNSNSNSNPNQQPQPHRSFSQPPPIPRVIRSATERLRTHNHHNSPETSNPSTNPSSAHPTRSTQPTPPSSTSIINPPTPNNSTRVFSIRLVPHLDATRSLHFEPIQRNVPPSSSLKLGRFTDRGLPQANSDTRIAFKSKVVSRGHADIFTDHAGAFFIKDTKSSSGTFLNHIRLSAPGGESRPFPLRDGDVLQLGVDYQGGTEEIYRCVKMRVELNRGWQRSANAFNQQALAQLQSLGAKGSTTLSSISKPNTRDDHITPSIPTQSGTLASIETEPLKPVSDCCICLFGVTVCQALFIAPCSHTYHYKCIRPLLQMHHPGFSCPLCRTFADLEADVETEDMLTPSSNLLTSGQPSPSDQINPVAHHDNPVPIPHQSDTPRDRSTLIAPNTTSHLSLPSSSPPGIIEEEESEPIPNVDDDDRDSSPMITDIANQADRSAVIPTATVNDRMDTTTYLPVANNHTFEINHNHSYSHSNNKLTSGLMIVNQPMMMGLVVEEHEDQLQASSTSEISSASDEQEHISDNLITRRSSVQSDDGSLHDRLSPTRQHLPQKSPTPGLRLPVDPLLLSHTTSFNHHHESNNNKNLDQLIESSSPNTNIDTTDVDISPEN